MVGDGRCGDGGPGGVRECGVMSLRRGGVFENDWDRRAAPRRRRNRIGVAGVRMRKERGREIEG